ncbi:hypothetical protein BH23THE1_BH23THE1_20620 [soil metagenome]
MYWEINIIISKINLYVITYSHTRSSNGNSQPYFIATLIWKRLKMCVINRIYYVVTTLFQNFDVQLAYISCDTRN